MEDLHKISKKMMPIKQFHGRSKRGVKQELNAHFGPVTLTLLFANHSETQLQHTTTHSTEPENAVQFQAFPLAVVNRHLDAAAQTQPAGSRCHYRHARQRQSYETMSHPQTFVGESHVFPRLHPMFRREHCRSRLDV